MNPKPSKTKPKKCKHWISPTKDTDGICTERVYAYEYCKGYDRSCSDYSVKDTTKKEKGCTTNVE